MYEWIVYFIFSFDLQFVGLVQLLGGDLTERLGYKGSTEVKNHSFFTAISTQLLVMLFEFRLTSCTYQSGKP